MVKRSLNPLFNHTMVYDGFQAKDLAEACAEFTLWHHEAFSKRQLGGIRLSLGTGEQQGPPGPSGCPQCHGSGVTGWCLRREQLRAARGLDGLDAGGAGGVEAAAAAARALGGGAAAPADQPGPPGVAPEDQPGLWDPRGGDLCGLRSVPSPPGSNEVTPEGTSGRFYCCENIWWLFIALATIS